MIISIAYVFETILDLYTSMTVFIFANSQSGVHARLGERVVHKNVIPIVPARRKTEPTTATVPKAKVEKDKVREASEKQRRVRVPSPSKNSPPLEPKRSKKEDLAGVRGREKKVGSHANEKERMKEEESTRRSRHLRLDLERVPSDAYERVEREEEMPKGKRRREEEVTRGGSSAASSKKDKGGKERVQDGKGGSGPRKDVKWEGKERKAVEGRVEKRKDDRGLDDLTEKLKLRKERFGLVGEGGNEVERSSRKRRWND